MTDPDHLRFVVTVAARIEMGRRGLASVVSVEKVSAVLA